MNGADDVAENERQKQGDKADDGGDHSSGCFNMRIGKKPLEIQPQ